MRYVAYGSNMSLAQMAKRLGRVPAYEIAHLRGYRLAFNKPVPAQRGFAYANIVPADDVVVGIIYDCTSEELDTMDGFEGVATGDYKREVVIATVGGREEPAVVYVGCVSSTAPDLRPTEEYLGRILAGASDHALPGADIERIRRAAGQ